ncbi:MAG: hypothetical protein HY720_20900 [Planctomycetes bacterium]|nr:hypothetical protein [Planctomycetota bacterium]
MESRILLFAALVVALSLFPVRAHGQSDAEEVSCDDTGGFAVMGDPAATAGASLSVGPGREGAGAVELRFRRVAGVPVVLAQIALLTGLVKLEFDLRSALDAQILVAVEDLDHARFHHVESLAAGTWKRVSLSPADFQLAGDSAVKKEAIDPDRLGIGWGLADLSGVLGAEGENTLSVDSVRIERAPLPEANLPDVVDGKTVEITKSGRHMGDIAIRGGGVLRIAAPRFVLAGNISVEGGTFEVVGTALTLESAFVHQRRIDAAGDSRVALRDVRMVNRFLPSIEVKDGAELDIDGLQAIGQCISTVCGDRARVSVRRANWPGEFMIFPGSHVRIAESNATLLWLGFGENGKGSLALPDGSHVESWRVPAGLGLDVEVASCDSIFWGLMSFPGTDLVIADSHLSTAAITIWSDAEIDGVKNGDATAGDHFRFTDRTLRFERTTVDVWNVYTMASASVTIKNSTLGECWAMGESKLTLLDSTVDGKGGYVMACDRGTYRIEGCRLDCDVVAKDDATLDLSRCELAKDLAASGRARVRKATTTVAGKVECLESAKIEEGK